MHTPPSTLIPALISPLCPTYRGFTLKPLSEEGKEETVEEWVAMNLRVNTAWKQDRRLLFSLLSFFLQYISQAGPPRVDLPSLTFLLRHVHTALQF